MLKAHQLIENTLADLAFLPFAKLVWKIRDYPPCRWLLLWWLNWRVPSKDRRRHVYITGRSGCGKSEILKLLAYSEIKKKNSTVVVLDPHGDLVEEIARFKLFGRQPDRLVYLDPCLKEGLSPTINPFEVKGLTDQEIDSQAQQITRSLAELIKKSNLTLQMEALLMPCVATLLRRPDSDFTILQRFMITGKNDDLVELGRQSPNPAHAAFFETAFHSKNYEPTKHSIFTKLQSLLNTKTFYHLTNGRSTIELEKELNRKKVLLLNLSKGKMGADASEAYGRLLLALIQGFALRRAKIPKAFRSPIYLFIDEFHNYISPSIEIILAEARKYGLHLVLASQTVGYGMDESLKELVLSNTSVKIIGMNSPKSLAILSKDTGIEQDRLQQLGVRQFFIKSGSKSPFRLYAPGFLAGNHAAMKPNLWKDLLNSSLNRFYRKPSTTIGKPSVSSQAKGILKPRYPV